MSSQSPVDAAPSYRGECSLRNQFCEGHSFLVWQRRPRSPTSETGKMEVSSPHRLALTSSLRDAVKGISYLLVFLGTSLAWKPPPPVLYIGEGEFQAQPEACTFPLMGTKGFSEKGEIPWVRSLPATLFSKVVPPLRRYKSP